MSNDELCVDCKTERQSGLIGGYFYKRCPFCMAKYDAKKRENRELKLRRQKAALERGVRMETP